MDACESRTSYAGMVVVPPKLLPANWWSKPQHQTSLRHDRHVVSSRSARSRSCLHFHVVNTYRYVPEDEDSSRATTPGCESGTYMAILTTRRYNRSERIQMGLIPPEINHRQSQQKDAHIISTFRTMRHNIKCCDNKTTSNAMEIIMP
jgi:hypothetical protein